MPPIPDALGERFADAWRDVAAINHENAVAKGFWPENANAAEKIALMHSELSEALEAIRHANPPDKHLPQRDNLSVELADTVIRIMDFARHYGLPVAEAIIEKSRFNAGRPYKHGKAF